MPKVQCPLCNRYVIVNEEQMIWISFLLLLGKWQESHFLNEKFKRGVSLTATLAAKDQISFSPFAFIFSKDSTTKDCYPRFYRTIMASYFSIYIYFFGKL